MEETLTTSRTQAFFRLASLVVFEIAAIIVMHTFVVRLGVSVDWNDFSRWIKVTPADDAAFALVGVLGLVAAYWLAASTLLYLIARITQIPAFVRSAGLLTLPGVRRVVDGAVALTIVGSSLLAAKPAGAARETAVPTPTPMVQTVSSDDSLVGTPGVPSSTAPRGSTTVVTTPDNAYVPIIAGDKAKTTPTLDGSTTSEAPSTTSPGTSSPGGIYTPTPAGEIDGEVDDTTTTSPSLIQGPSTTSPGTSSPRATGPTTTRPSTPTTEVPGAPGAPQVAGEQVEQYTVVPGDNFWVIAERHLETQLGRQASLDEIRTYWLKVIDANRSVIRSGDPNLIFPGEVFTLPAV